MKRCDRCGVQRDWAPINNIIKDAVKEVTYCPNCMAIAYLENELNFINDPNLIDDITGEAGAVEFIAVDEHYVLKNETMLRLIAHNLKPEEYFALVEKYGPHKYMIHEDFYTADGLAWQALGVDYEDGDDWHE